ncbi:hypothetical protein Gogos_003337 [Gossypium gossypioides]|uniref:Uncharacterized protein n=1 Tax=Gossypium gossypioides TaxID=34282 RepID=A0A7J9CLM8_GOSGO|nr:hypothetical protein [Gossypium gossypioides]
MIGVEKRCWLVASTSSGWQGRGKRKFASEEKNLENVLPNRKSEAIGTLEDVKLITGFLIERVIVIKVVKFEVEPRKKRTLDHYTSDEKDLKGGRLNDEEEINAVVECPSSFSQPVNIFINPPDAEEMSVDATYNDGNNFEFSDPYEDNVPKEVNAEEDDDDSDTDQCILLNTAET